MTSANNEKPEFLFPFWIKYTRDGAEASFCVEATDAGDAIRESEHYLIANSYSLAGSSIRVKKLPYPASPRIRRTDGRASSCPTFCMHGKDCAGKSSCPRSLACSE